VVERTSLRLTAAVAGCVLAIFVWVFAIPNLSGWLSGALLLAIALVLVIGGWVSAWSFTALLAVPAAGKLSEVLGTNSTPSDMTAVQAAVVIIAPIAAVLVTIGLVVGHWLRPLRRRS
jgi:hypothetical protein